MKPDYKHVYVILNPVAGNSDPEKLRQAIEQICQQRNWNHTVYVTTGEEKIAHVARQAVEQGADLLIAAGGDGTVAGVINGMRDTHTPIGIIPVGTGNGLARAMNIPLDPEQAMQLIAGENTLLEIDAMQVGDEYYVLNVSAGISARTMLSTKPEEKQRLGILAYAQKMLQDLAVTEPVSFNLQIDGLQVNVQATEVLVSNGEILKEPPFLFGSRDHFTDGKLNVNILTAASPKDYVRLAWELLIDPKETKEELHDLTVYKNLRIDVEDQIQPVQADGEVIGETPVEITLVPRAIPLIVPLDEDTQEK